MGAKKKWIAKHKATNVDIELTQKQKESYESNPALQGKYVFIEKQPKVKTDNKPTEKVEPLESLEGGSTDKK